MLKRTFFKRIASVFLTVIMLMTFMVPATANGGGFDDLATVVDLTGGDFLEPEPSVPPSGNSGDDAQPSSYPSGNENSESFDTRGESPREQEGSPASLGMSGVPDWEEIPDGYVIRTGNYNGISLFSDSSNTIYFTKDASIQHRYPFSGGTSMMPAYIFYTVDGRAAYCIEPAKFNSTYGTIVTGSYTYSGLSASKQNQIARVISANTSGTSNHRMYFAAQVVIWEICAGQSHRSGSIYNACITPNGLFSEYESIMSAMNSVNGEIPSFMSPDKTTATLHDMPESGGSWSAALTNTNSSITLNAGDFKTKAPFTFSVSGNTLTVTSPSEPDEDAFVEWSGNGNGGGSGLVFWNSNEQGKVSQAETGGIPGVGYMRFSETAVPIPEDPEEEEPKLGYLTIYKYDGETNLPLGGAVFRVECEGFINEAFVVPYGGATIVIPIPEGKDSVEVTVTEVTPPYQYVGDPTPQTVTVTAGEIVNIAEVGFANYPQECSLTIYKYEHGNYGVPLEGAKFRIRYADPNVSAQVWVLTTDSSGTIKIDLPAAGTLIIEELEAPAGYVIGHISTWDVVVAKGEHKQIDISNDKKADLIVYKRDAQTGQLLSGAVIKATLLRSHTPPYEQNMSYTVTTDENGVALFTNMIPGEYRIEEQSPPQYYLPTDTVYTVSVYDGSTETVTVTFENEPWTGLTIRKVDATNGNGLAGAVFKPYEGTAAETAKFLGDFMSNENGVVVIQNLESNRYYTIVEAQAPYGYFVDQENSIQTILIKPDAIDKNLTVVFRNLPKPKLLITKIDEATGTRLPGAVFRVAERGSAEYVEVTTGSDGTVLLENLSENWYQVTEIRSPTGYLLDSTVHDIELIAGETAKLVVNNSKQPSLIIEKIDEATGLRLSGAVFRIAPRDGGEYQEVTTGSNGIAVVDGLAADWYTVTEIRSPSGYILDETPHTVQLSPGKTTTLRIGNVKKPNLTIRKVDEQTGEGIEGVVLRVTKEDAVEFQDVTTGKNGIATITGMSPGWVTIVEQRAKDGYILDQTPHYIELKPGQDAEIVINNRHKPSLKIVKLDSVTKQPLQYVTFRIAYKNGNPIGEFTTDESGEIYLEDIDPGTLVITEAKGRDGYIILDEEKEVLVEWGKLTTVEFLNQPKNPILIKKVDSETGEPLPGAVFTVTKVNGEFVGEYTTGRNGFITVTGQLPGFYTATEIKCPDGYILNSTPKIVELKLDQPAEVVFENKPLNGIQIHKIDADTREPLEGVKFVVREKGGSVIGEFVTNSNGLIDVPDLSPGWYQVFESAGLPGYLLDSSVKDVELKWNDHVLIEFTNTKLSGLQVRKIDSVTKEPIPGVKFKLTKMNGEYVGDYVTNSGGYFAVSDLEPGWYTCYETATIPGYVLDTTPQNIEIKKGKSAVLEFENKPLSGLQIRKSDSVTGLPLAGVEFKLTELDGRIIGNYTTDSAGIVFVPNLREGWYIITEVKGLEGYKPDTAPRNIQVKTGELNIVEYRNHPYPNLIVQKIDADTLQPLEGVRFRLLDKYSREIGIFKTNAQGKIHLTGMDGGIYYLQEVEAREGYVLDATVREVSLQYGKTTTVEIKNTPMSTLRIRKIDAVTKKPVAGVSFMLYDWKNNIVGEYITDNNGIIELPREIAAGKYKLKEVKAADGYVLDETLRTIELKANETTEIVIENEPIRGRIQIVKKAAGYNDITKDKEGALLEGAMFEIIDNRNEVVDRIETDDRGVATSKLLPTGVYGIREITAPKHYLLDDKIFYAEIKVHNDLIKFEVLNEPADISVTVQKYSNYEALLGQNLRYDFKDIANTSSVELDDLYFHDAIPTDAVRLVSISTGTWNERLTYKVLYATNLRRDYRVAGG